MTFAERTNQTEIKGKELDTYLEKGWFRLGESIFTTSFLCFDKKFYNALWLRIDLKNFEGFTDSQKSILKKIEGKFRIEVQPFEITLERSELFLKYRENIAFNAAEGLEFVVPPENAFESYCVSIYDGEKLVGCGVFDKGSLAAEGITSFYDPDYKKFSIGKALILLKVKHLLSQGFLWFYPGYYAPGFPRFNYKLDISKSNTEFYNIVSSGWEKLQSLKLAETPLGLMKTKLERLEKILHSFGFTEAKLFKYRFFDLNLDKTYNEYRLLQLPYFIYCFAVSNVEDLIIAFDVFKQEYKLMSCLRIFKLDTTPDNEFYSDYLIRQKKVLLQSSDPYYIAFTITQQILNKDIQTQV